MKTKNPSPSRSQGAHTPRRKSRRTLSVGSPALSTASGRLTSIVQGFVNQQMDSFVLSPLPKRRSVLTDNTEVVEEPRRKSWWKKLNENSRDALEALEDNNLAEPYNIMEELDMEILSQEPRKEKNITSDIPESDSESIHSIVIPQKKLFPAKENRHQKFDQIVGNRESMTKSNKNMTINDIVVNAGRKELFQNHPRSKPLFPAALLDITPDKTIMNKTKEPAESKQQTRNLFGNRPGTKRKNMFANFIASESEDEIPEIQPKVFQFPKKLEPKRRGSSASRGVRESSPMSNITDTEMDEWRLLPSSTMVEHQLEAALESNTPKRPRLSKLSETKETSSSLVSSKTKSPEANTSMLTRSKLRALNNSATSTGAEKNRTLLEKSQKNQSKRISFRKNVNESREIGQSVQDEEQIQEVGNDNVIVEVAQEANQSHNIQKKQNDFIISSQNAIDLNQEVEDDDKVSEHQEVEVNHEEVGKMEQEQDQNQEEESENKNNKCQEIAKEDVEENLINKSQEKEDENEEHVSKSKEKLDESVEQEIKADQGQQNVDTNSEVQNEIQEHADNDDVDAGDDDENEVSEAEASINKEVEDVKVDERQNIELTHEEVGVTEQEQDENQEEESENIDNVSQEVAEKDGEESEVRINESQEDDGNENEDNVSESKEELDESMEQEDEVDYSQQEVDHSQEEVEVDENNEEIDQSQVDDTENVPEIDRFVDKSNQSNEEAKEGNEITDHSRELDKSNQVANESDRVNEFERSQMKEYAEIDENNQKANESSQEVNESIQEANESSQEANESVDEANESIQEANESIYEANESNEKVNQSQETDDESNELENEIQEDSETEAVDVDENEDSEAENEDEEAEAKVSENENEVSENDNEVSQNEDEEAEVEVSENENEDFEDENENVEDENEAVEEDESENAELHYESASDEMKVDDELQNDQDDNTIDQSNKTNSPEPAHNESNISHDTTGRNRHKHTSPEAILHDKTQRANSFTARRNTSIRENKTIGNLLRGKPSLMPTRDSVGFSDGTTNSSAEGSGWDSHRTTRKTIRQTFGRDATPRKSLRALVMEKSAKRQTMPYNSTAVSGMPEISLGYLDIQPIPQESPHEMSLRTRQLTLDAVLDKVKEDNLKKKAELEAAVKKSLAARSDAHIFKVPARPMFPRRQGNQQNITSKVKPMWRGLPDEMIDDLQYKPPKRFKPTNAPWITKRLYKFLETKLEPKYDYKARVRAEKLVETVYNFTKDLRRQPAASEESTNELKHEMARLLIVKTHHDFYEFFRQYMPKEIRIKVIPDVVNKLPLPRRDVFSDIICTESMRG